MVKVNETNKDKLHKKISEFIDSVLKKADEEGKLDHINIEISNHAGNLQMDYTLRDRKKAY